MLAIADNDILDRKNKKHINCLRRRT